MSDIVDPISDPFIDTTFAGKYRITRKLGQGGMGSVYVAEHLLINRDVALKVLRSDLVEEEVLLKRFQREARTASKLSHPNAVLLYDFGVEDNIPYLVMEYIKGPTLKTVLAKERLLDLKRTATILRQICSALAEAHRLGIIHRDIKPENFILSSQEDGKEIVKVLDFGVAKTLAAKTLSPDPSLTQAGMIIGTPQYMSPEQCMAKEVDTRSDIYSLGAVVYEMLTGRPPFTGKTVFELLSQVVSIRPMSMREVSPQLNIPPAVDRAIMRALEKDPMRRHATVEEFFGDFEEALPFVLESGTTISRAALQIDAAISRLSSRGLPRIVLVGGTIISVCGLLFLLAPGKKHGSITAPKVEATSTTPANEAAALEAETLRRRGLEEAEALQKSREEALRLELESKRQAEERLAEALRQAEATKAEAEQLLKQAKRSAEENKEPATALQTRPQAPASQNPDLDLARKKREEERRIQERELAEAVERANREKAEAEKQAAALKEEARRHAAAAAKAHAEIEKSKSRQYEAAKNAPAEETSSSIAPGDTAPATDDRPKAKRRRCGPNWCL